MDSNNSQDDNGVGERYGSDEIPLNTDYYMSDHSGPVDDSDETPGPESQSLFHTQKWARLRRHYNDRYLDLFKDTFASRDEDFPVGDLPPTQLGAVLWNSSEKEKLYDALCRKGRRELGTLAEMVGSKSEVEIKAYLDSLREQETDRQLFEAQPKNISHADIPAAVEIGPECEAVLDRAAEALSAFQEQYDFAAGQQTSDLWLIDTKAAANLDQMADQADGSGDDADVATDDAAPTSELVTELFHLSTFLALSERFIMNKSLDDPDAWQNLGEEGQHPALTMDLVTGLYDLVVSLTRRLVQTSLFIAKSRLRSATSLAYKPRSLVRHDDVSAALAILNVTRNSQQHWVGLARRNGLSVVDNAHRKGANANQELSYDEVEAILSSPRRRRRRSASTGSDDSVLGESSSGDSVPEMGEAESQSPEADTQDHRSSEGLASDEEDEEASDSLDDDNHNSDENRPNVPTSRQKKRYLRDDEQDQYLEQLDQGIRREEEPRLLSFLGTPGVKPIKEEGQKHGEIRPQVLRKTSEECLGWSVRYQSEWERYGEVLPAESFSVPGARSKKRRID